MMIISHTKSGSLLLHVWQHCYGFQQNLSNFSSFSSVFMRTAVTLIFFISIATTPLRAQISEPEDKQQITSSTPFEQSSQKLISKSYKKKEAAIEILSNLKDQRTIKLFKALLRGDLYYLKKDKQIFITKKQGDEYSLYSILDNQHKGTAKKSALKKVRTNNKVRKILRGEIARLSLEDDDPKIRYTAIVEIISTLDDESISLLRSKLPTEKNENVREVISVAIASKDSLTAKHEKRMEAIKTLGDSLFPLAKTTLLKITARKLAKTASEEEMAIQEAATKALGNINTKVKIANFSENIFFGLSLGSVLLLAAIGLSITFGVMGVINMAHGELIMIGAYTTYFVQLLFPQMIEYSLFISIPAAFIVSGLFGIVIERTVIRHLYGRPLETLLATFGVSLLLQQLVRTTISAQNVIVTTPAWMSGSMQINPVLSITYNRLYIILFSLLVFASLLYILNKTVLGLQIRAVSQNRSMAKAMGIRSDWVDALTFGLGSGIAGLAGVALSQLTNVGPNLGQAYIIDSFMVVVFGGVGNLWGTLVGAFSLGVINKFLEPWAGAVLAKILVLVFIILFIQKKPRGLFPKQGRAAED